MIQGLNVDDARIAASHEVAGVAQRRNGGTGQLQEVGEIPTLVMATRDALQKLDREFMQLRDKMSPVLAPEYPTATDTHSRMKADSAVGDELSGIIHHMECLANAVVELRSRTKL